MARRLNAGRALARLMVVLGVVLAHGWVAERWAESRVGWGAGEQAPPPRLEVAFVRELAPAPPPAATKPKPKRVHKRRVAPPPPAASTPADTAAASALAESDPASAAAETAAAPIAKPEVVAAESPAEPASIAEAAPGPQAPASAVADAPPAFEWPPSTRLSYTLTGNYRGELHGSAQVQWVRIGTHYQVHLDVSAGLVFRRRMSSDGELADDGLTPRRYDEETQLLWQEPRRLTMWFEPERVVLANGQRRDRWPGVQDTASQFVQLAWLFTSQPQLLQTGRSIDLPLALPRRIKWVTLDVVDQERLYTPIGELDTFHLKPRLDAKPGNDLSAEIWFAPALQYLPVRIRIEQDADNYIDLMIRSRPLQAEP
jgi:hypothetical protein